MFKPGHWHRSSLPGQEKFSLDIYYEVRRDAGQGVVMHFSMTGEVAGKVFKDDFELHRDTAFNFASIASRIAARHGLSVGHSLIMHDHAEYDRMFEDIRHKLGGVGEL